MQQNGHKNFEKVWQLTNHPTTNNVDTRDPTGSKKPKTLEKSKKWLCYKPEKFTRRLGTPGISNIGTNETSRRFHNHRELLLGPGWKLHLLAFMSTYCGLTPAYLLS